jgi:glycerophosphoryl diester phosphodiesterase
VEADVFLVDGELLVAHDRDACVPSRSLTSLYLDPLFRRYAAAGAIQPGVREFTLLVDLKSGAVETYAALRDLLQRYARLPGGEAFVTHWVRGETIGGAVTVIVSGNRPVQVMEAEWDRWAALDGRSQDLASVQPVELMPLISERWGQLFQWNGVGPMAADERRKLRVYADAAHAKGRKVRFWATPDLEAAWSELLAAGVDIISTDDIPRLAGFLSARQAGHAEAGRHTEAP